MGKADLDDQSSIVVAAADAWLVFDVVSWTASCSRICGLDRSTSEPMEIPTELDHAAQPARSMT